jgi:hypothetical protein
MGIVYIRGGQLHQLGDPHFRRQQQSARVMYSTLKFIARKYRSVLTANTSVRLYELL